MSRTHDVTISAFDLDRLEAELTAVTEERDKLKSELEFRKGLFKLQEQTLEECIVARDEARRQRDKLSIIAGELVAMIRVNAMRGRFKECTVEEINEHLKLWIDKIAELKQANPADQYIAAIEAGDFKDASKIFDKYKDTIFSKP